MEQTLWRSPILCGVHCTLYRPIGGSLVATFHPCATYLQKSYLSYYLKRDSTVWNWQTQIYFCLKSFQMQMSLHIVRICIWVAFRNDILNFSQETCSHALSKWHWPNSAWSFSKLRWYKYEAMKMMRSPRVTSISVPYKFSNVRKKIVHRKLSAMISQA